MLPEKDSLEASLPSADSRRGSTKEAHSVVRDADVAARFLASLDDSVKHRPITPKEARKVLWKIDLTILPLLGISVIIACVDKLVISNAAIYGMATDTKLVGDKFAWVGSVFYFGFLLFEYPSSFLIQRLPVAKFFSATALVWATMMCCTAATNNFAGLATVRFIMGMSEACLFPVCNVFTVMWWKNQEQPFRIACWMSPFSSIFIGIVGYGVGNAHTSLASWRLLYLVLGGFSLLWAAVLFLLLPDSPTQCRYMCDREKFVCLERIKSNNTGVEDKKIKWYQVRECFCDPKTWLLIVFGIAQNIPNGAITTFAAIIVSGMGYTPLATALLGIPTGIVAALWAWLLSWPAGRLAHARCLLVALSNLVTIASALLMWHLPRSNKVGLLASYYAFYTYWAAYVLGATLPLANTSGHSKKVATNALVFVAYCVGNIVGPQLFRDVHADTASDDDDDGDHGRRYAARGYAGLLVCLVVAMAAILAYGALCAVENRRRDRHGGVVVVSAAHHGEGSDDDGQRRDDDEPQLAEGGEGAFSDKTDREKKDFRYTY
ncbi:putative transporter [Lasiodiplodia theobromae]|uniref:Putative transporter n=1 Tax=Lasiodiplodia theobromae TaxID=45133 RepID=A0A5N5DG18_9PEZI|nr:putative transporter [Lasiodiplodia theobromae]